MTRRQGQLEIKRKQKIVELNLHATPISNNGEQKLRNLSTSPSRLSLPSLFLRSSLRLFSPPTTQFAEGARPKRLSIFSSHSVLLPLPLPEHEVSCEPSLRSSWSQNRKFRSCDLIRGIARECSTSAQRRVAESANAIISELAGERETKKKSFDLTSG